MEWLFAFKIINKCALQLQTDKINAHKIVVEKMFSANSNLLNILSSFFVMYEITISNQPSAI